jgi:hypothetical protein
VRRSEPRQLREFGSSTSLIRLRVEWLGLPGFIPSGISVDGAAKPA